MCSTRCCTAYFMDFLLCTFQNSFQLKSIFWTKSIFSFLFFFHSLQFWTKFVCNKSKWIEMVWKKWRMNYKERTISRWMLKLSIYLSNTKCTAQVVESNKNKAERAHTQTLTKFLYYKCERCLWSSGDFLPLISQIFWTVYACALAHSPAKRWAIINLSLPIECDRLAICLAFIHRVDEDCLCVLSFSVVVVVVAVVLPSL